MIIKFITGKKLRDYAFSSKLPSTKHIKEITKCRDRKRQYRRCVIDDIRSRKGAKIRNKLAASPRVYMNISSNIERSYVTATLGYGIT